MKIYGINLTGSFYATQSGLMNISASYALTSSYALNGGGGPTVSASYALSSSYADTTLTASYALNGGGSGASSFIDLTDTPNSYSTYANKVVRVNPESNGLVFGDIPTGLAISWATESYSQTIAATTTGTAYSGVGYEIKINMPIKIVSMSYSASNAENYNIYLGNNIDGTSITNMLFESASLSVGDNILIFSSSLLLWGPQTYYLIIKSNGANVNFKYLNALSTTEYYSTIQGKFFPSLTGNYSPGIKLIGQRYDYIDEYGVSSSVSYAESSSYSLSSDTAISASYALTASYVEGISSESSSYALSSSYSDTSLTSSYTSMSIDELSNVDTTGLQNGYVLSYNQSLQKWVPVAMGVSVIAVSPIGMNAISLVNVILSSTGIGVL